MPPCDFERFRGRSGLVLSSSGYGYVAAERGGAPGDTESEIRQAFDDFHRGVLGDVPRDHPLAPTNELAAETNSSLD